MRGFLPPTVKQEPPSRGSSAAASTPRSSRTISTTTTPTSATRPAPPASRLPIQFAPAIKEAADDEVDELEPESPTFPLSGARPRGPSFSKLPPPSMGDLKTPTKSKDKGKNKPDRTFFSLSDQSQLNRSPTCSLSAPLPSYTLHDTPTSTCTRPGLETVHVPLPWSGTGTSDTSPAPGDALARKRTHQETSSVGSISSITGSYRQPSARARYDTSLDAGPSRLTQAAASSSSSVPQSRGTPIDADSRLQLLTSRILESVCSGSGVPAALFNDVVEHCPDCDAIVASAVLARHRLQFCTKSRTPGLPSEPADDGWTCPACGETIRDDELRRKHIASPHLWCGAYGL